MHTSLPFHLMLENHVSVSDVGKNFDAAIAGQTPAVELQAFHLFPKLPVEVRSMVVRQVYPDPFHLGDVRGRQELGLVNQEFYSTVERIFKLSFTENDSNIHDFLQKMSPPEDQISDMLSPYSMLSPYRKALDWAVNREKDFFKKLTNGELNNGVEKDSGKESDVSKIKFLKLKAFEYLQFLSRFKAEDFKGLTNEKLKADYIPEVLEDVSEWLRSPHIQNYPSYLHFEDKIRVNNKISDLNGLGLLLRSLSAAKAEDPILNLDENAFKRLIAGLYSREEDLIIGLLNPASKLLTMLNTTYNEVQGELYDNGKSGMEAELEVYGYNRDGSWRDSESLLDDSEQDL
jgi:hypothetical protein